MAHDPVTRLDASGTGRLTEGVPLVRRRTERGRLEAYRGP